MIKLIVSDLDGTLLNSQKMLSENSRRVIRELEDRGIIFVAASGRSRPSILSYFGNTPIATVSDNGGTAYSAKGELLFVGDFSYEKAKPVMEVIRETSYMHLALIGVDNIYVQEDSPQEHKDFVARFFNNMIQIVPNLDEMFFVDKMSKLSINTGGHRKNEKKGMELMRQFEEDFSLVLSGDGWVDLMKKGVTKGSTLERLCEHYGIAMDETIAFGDYLNDLDMLMRTPNSYAIANAQPNIKEACAHVTRYTNDEDGVARALIDIFGLSPIED
ncbi:MAG: HAD family hydrolase [Lachnospiraceae bacterium]|nr:HAD family hydrolase [Lachnospiraceae bacterium]